MAAADSKEIQWRFRNEVWTRKLQEGNLKRKTTWKISIGGIDNSTKIKELEQEEVCKYLGVNENSGI